MASEGQKFKKYSIEFKKEIVEEKIIKGKSYAVLSRKYGIPKGTINTWVYQYKKNNHQTLSKKRGRPNKDQAIDYKERYEILKKFQDYLLEVDREKK